MTDIVTKNPSMGLKLSTLLVIDDEPNVRYSLRQSLEDANLRVVTADNARHGLDAIELEQPDAVLLDVRLPDMSGLDLFCKIHELRPQLPVVVITAHGTTDTAIEATKRGAFDYLLKPFELPRLRAVVQRALEASRLARDAQSIADGNPVSVDDLIVGQSPAMQEVYKAIGRVAPTNLNVLLLGESGTGKGVVAQTIYQHSRRSHRPFLRINCAAFPDDLLESELFGYERGAFSGAENRHVGRFEQAAGGTIFLDEIGDMSPATQAKVLRLLQEQQFERIGGNDTIRSDVRVIAATNQNLDDLTEAGKFRRDLYFRLKVYSVNLPPLRERLDDLPLLVSHFIRLHTGETVRSVRGVTDETLGLMKRYLWPGNVRELQSAVEYALVNATSEILTPETLPPNVAAGINLASRAEIVSPDHRPLTSFVRGLLETGDEDIYRKVIYLVDRLVLNEVLLTVGGNQVEASRRLGISRTTLRSKIHTQQLLDATSDAGAETEVPRQAADPSEGTS